MNQQTEISGPTDEGPVSHHSGVAGAGSTEPAGVWASLRALDGTPVLRCPTDQVGEAGLHLTAPKELQFAVGQRYEVVLEEAREASTASGSTDGCYATVVRTEPRPTGGTDGMGVGLRFDHPLVI